MTRAHILVQALSGKGKTFWSCMGGKPYVLAPEQKCRAIIPLINPQAMVFPLETKEDFDKATIAVQSGKLVENGYTRIVLDSFSELTEYIPGWFGMGFPLQIQDYGTIGNKAMSLVLAMLKSPIPGIVICRSEAKEQGKVHRVIPGSLGKSAGNLPAKLVLTAETRYDEQAGWVVDTTPDDYTQRAGLPWVPSVFQGSADDFLALVEAGPTCVNVFTVPAEEPVSPMPQTVPERIAKAKEATEWLDAVTEYNEALLKNATPIEKRTILVREFTEKGPSALKELKKAIEAGAPKSVGAMLAQIPPPVKPEPQPMVENFVDQVAQGPQSPVLMSQEEWGTLEELIKKHNIDRAGFIRFCETERHLVPTSKGEYRLDRMLKSSYDKLESILLSDPRRRGFVAHIVQNFSQPAAI